MSQVLGEEVVVVVAAVEGVMAMIAMVEVRKTSDLLSNTIYSVLSDINIET